VIQSTAPSTLSVTTTDSLGNVVTTAPPVVTNTLTSTGANGTVYTVTQIVHNPNAGSNSGQPSSTPFLQNTGAVAGTFVAVGLLVTAGILTFIFFMLKRRRRQRLDRDVAAAAAAAAAAAGSKGYEDEEDNPAMTQYGGYYAATTPGIEVLDHPQPNMGAYDYEDPAGGYDHYAANLGDLAGDRSSTATAPGLAGFGAQSAQQNYAQVHDPYSAVSTDHSGPATAQQNQYYFDPKQAFDFAEEDAYGGVEGRQGHHRAGSEGSITRGSAEDRSLKVTNV